MLSRKSVLLLNNDGGGSVVLKSSRKKRFPPALVGDANGLPDWIESLVSRRRLPGRDDVGDETPKAVELFCDVDIDDFRPAIPLTGVFSLEAFCGGGLRGELTVVENNSTRGQQASKRSIDQQHTSFSSSLMSTKPKG